MENENFLLSARSALLLMDAKLSSRQLWQRGAFALHHLKAAGTLRTQNTSFPATSLFPKTCHANGCYPRGQLRGASLPLHGRHLNGHT